MCLHQEYNLNSLLEHVCLFCSLFCQTALYMVFWVKFWLDIFWLEKHKGESNCQNIQEVIYLLSSLKQKAQVKKKNMKPTVFKLINNLSESATVLYVCTNYDAFRSIQCNEQKLCYQKGASIQCITLKYSISSNNL